MTIFLTVCGDMDFNVLNNVKTCLLYTSDAADD